MRVVKELFFQLKAMLLVDPKDVFATRNRPLLALIAAVILQKPLYSLVNKIGESQRKQKVSSVGQSGRKWYRDTINTLIPYVLGDSPNKHYSILYYGLAVSITYFKLRAWLLESSHAKLASLGFFLLNTFYYINLQPKRSKFTPTISSLYVDQGWTIAFQYAACAGYLFWRNTKAYHYLQFICATAGIFVFRTGRTNFNSLGVKSHVVFEAERTPSNGQELDEEGFKELWSVRDEATDKRRHVREGDPDDLLELVRSKKWKDLYMFQTSPSYPFPDSPNLSNFHMFFVMLLGGLTYWHLYHQQNYRRFLPGLVAFVGYSWFGSAAMLLYEDLEEKEKYDKKSGTTAFGRFSLASLVLQRKYIELLCHWSFTCELFLLCETLAYKMKP